MKNICLLLLYIVFAVQISFAQNAPDFTIVDSKGNTHNLYEDYLDKGKVVLLDLFFVDCPPCNDMAPALEYHYKKWGSGAADVQFIGISDRDSDSKVNNFKEKHGNTFPAAGIEGGGKEANEPYSSGTFGEFAGYPTLIVISPDGSMVYDIWDNSIAETMILMNKVITDALNPISSAIEIDESIVYADVFPNLIGESAVFSLEMKVNTYAEILIRNIDGAIVQNIFEGTIKSGQTQFPFDMINLAAGNYFISINTEDNQQKSLPIIKID